MLKITLNSSEEAAINLKRGEKLDTIVDKTDDLQILLSYNPQSKIRFIKGEESNFKLTTKREIQIIKELLKLEPMLLINPFDLKFVQLNHHYLKKFL